MKKNDIFLLVSAGIFSGLFYQQAPGINFLLFSLLVTLSVTYLNSFSLKENLRWYYFAAANASGVAVFLINSDLSILACIVSLLVFSSKFVHKENSIIANSFFAFYSIVSSFFYWIFALSSNSNQQEKTNARNKWKNGVGLVLSLLVVVVFFNLYKNANPLFNKFTQFINLDWLSFGWMAFTFFGFLILYGLLKSKRIEYLSVLDIEAKHDIEHKAKSVTDSDTFKTSTGLVLFSLLNVMLLILNGLDINTIFISHALPEGITLSDFVHEAVSNTVLSITLAIGFIVWLFRGSLNFTHKGKKLRFLIYSWIGQSAIMVANTILRNYNYIAEYQLTQLRIGVFVFLILCLLGLALTSYKLHYKKSAWQLLSLNAELWFFILILASLFNWDKIITQYNIQRVTATKTLDKVHLIELSDANIPELFDLYSAKQFSVEEETLFIQKCEAVHKKDRFRQWPSFNLRSYQNTAVVKSVLKK